MATDTPKTMTVAATVTMWDGSIHTGSVTVVADETVRNYGPDDLADYVLEPAFAAIAQKCANDHATVGDVNAPHKRVTA